MRQEEKKPHIVFIDPYASIKFLSDSLRSAGIQISAAYTNTNELQCDGYLKMHPEYFDHTIYLKNTHDVLDLITPIRDLKADRIYYGSEISVKITDKIAEKIFPQFSNSTADSESRYNKYEMQEALRRRGFPHIKQVKVSKYFTSEQQTEISSWRLPVIVKPVNNAAGIGVTKCNSIDEVKNYLVNQTNISIFNEPLTDFVIQEYIQGTEYFIDTFSVKNQHFISGVQRYQRALFNNSPLSLFSEIVLPNTIEYKICEKYTQQVLSLVGLKNGFAHTEIMLTNDGPFLIEVNPRISGAHGFNNKLFQICGFPSQTDLLIASCKNQPMPIIHKEPIYGMKALLQNNIQRIISDLNLSLLKQLPSFKEALMLKTPGKEYGQPSSLADTIAFVLLASPTKTQVLKDYAKILEWKESSQLF